MIAVAEGRRIRFECPLALNRKDGSVLVRVPAGEFEMGDGQERDCPKHKVRLSEYWIGVYCVTNRQYGRFVGETGRAGSGQKPDRPDHPVVNVSWEDAKSYAEWAGLSLATEAQWEKAARGPLGLLYPWGDGWDAGRARHAGNRGSEETCAAWKYPEGASGYGTYQQSGNVWEWCADWHDDGYYRKSPPSDPAGPEGGSARAVRGGGWWGRRPVVPPRRGPVRDRPRAPLGRSGLPPREDGCMSPCFRSCSMCPAGRRGRPSGGRDSGAAAAASRTAAEGERECTSRS